MALEVVSKKLGHSRPSFTADVYRHTFEDEHDAATLELSELTSEQRNGGNRKPPKTATEAPKDDDNDEQDEDEQVA